MVSKIRHEREFKWAVKSSEDFTCFLKSAQMLALRVTSPKHVFITDDYLDTHDYWLHQHQIKCRIRKFKNKAELTFKNASKLKNGLAQRFEKTYRLSGRKNHLKILISLFGRTTYQNLFTIKNRRTIRQVHISTTTKAELCFDRVTIQKGRKRVGLKEIELEFQKGNFRDFLRFASKVTSKSGLMKQTKSKVKTAVNAFLPHQKNYFISSKRCLTSFPCFI